MPIGASAPPRVPVYFDGLLRAFAAGAWGRQVHLGLWDTAPSPSALAAPGAHAQAMARLDERVLALADVADGLRVLDVGCGLGGTLQALDARHRQMTLTGVNIDDRQLAACRSLQPRASNRMQWLQADATHLPLGDASVDRVLCIEAMFHFSSGRAFVVEAARVLAPGGVLAATDIVIDPALAPAADAAAIVAGFGPWPDLTQPDAAAHNEPADAPGLRLTQRTDITAQTAPSHAFTASGGERTHDPVSRACHALRRLHDRGALRVLLLRWDRVP